MLSIVNIGLHKNIGLYINIFINRIINIVTKFNIGPTYKATEIYKTKMRKLKRY